MAFTKEQILKLDALHSNARFKHRRENGTDVTICVLQDKHMKKDWVEAKVAGSGREAEEQALAEALAKAQPGERPLTPAEMAEKLSTYKERFGDIDTDGDSKPAKKSGKKQEQTEPAA